MSSKAQRQVQRLSARLDSKLFRLPIPPTRHDLRVKLDGFESFDAAVDRRRRLLKILSSGGGQACELNAALSHCQSGKRCESGSCPVCMRRFRLRWVGAVSAFIESSADSWFAMNLVPPNLIFPLGTLDQFDPRRWKDGFRKQIERSALAPTTMIGGIDFAVQAIGNSVHNFVWRPHLYCLVRIADPADITAAIGRHYRATNATPKPIRIRSLDRKDLLKSVSYSLKATFKRRVPVKDCRGNADTKHVGLTSDQMLELAPLLHIWGISSRIFRHKLWPQHTSTIDTQASMTIDTQASMMW